MAPAQSRALRGSFCLLASGGLAATSLFALPGGQQSPRVPVARSVEAASPSSRSVEAKPSNGIAALSLAGIAAGAGLLAQRAAGVQGRAVATADADAVPAPPPPFNPAQQLGAMDPLGYFDPLGFCTVGDEAAFRKLRSAEIKHGRVAMMASIGALMQHYVKLPGFEQVKGTFGAAMSGEGVLGLTVLFVASGILELAWRESDAREPGNFGDPFGLKMYTDEMRVKEISNGRMAMISVLGIFAAELATGKDAVAQFGLSALGGAPRQACKAVTASGFAGSTAARPVARLGAARAAAVVVEGDAPPPPPPFQPSEQIGALEPMGYFDPLSFCEVGDEAGFRKLRAAELKHGRVAMMASIGAIGQHFLKVPGFEGVRGTFGAMMTGEGVLGGVILFVACGILELAWRENDAREPGNFGDPFGLKMYTDEMRAKEISNGRMAMISVLGICAAELATGKDAIEQFGL
eukprot:CAMPEP_0204533238 /NCGR_PEP_ID=MMETSP0661-20131031/12166_1 /ASSEMBLY_ACC=CAM_ASM_000606 /TAXON_ID=109239 /ORGANISM="Alexandrium margalefi, Strain AMGDE01CS-322" /LENGTH=462 /DNA_ID=CAMNT_0051539563 /DNA_START=84 /DNA_END=1472 /DNA_ORIENTATION=-